MRLIGIPTSPYVRRTAISLELLAIPFTLEPLSAFAHFDAFQQLNPVVKAPTLICDNGDFLLDSSLILQFAEASLSHERSLWPQDGAARQQAFHSVGLALAACDKAVQIIYELRLRPEAARVDSLLERFILQAKAALNTLDTAIAQHASEVPDMPTQAQISAAVAWYFIHHSLPELFPVAPYANLVKLSASMEDLPAFQRYKPSFN